VVLVRAGDEEVYLLVVVDLVRAGEVDVEVLLLVVVDLVRAGVLEMGVVGGEVLNVDCCLTDWKIGEVSSNVD